MKSREQGNVTHMDVHRSQAAGPMPIHDDDDFDSYGSPGSHWQDSDDEGPDDADLAPDDMVTLPCTRCRKLIFEDVPRCPYCGHMQLEDDRNIKPLWFRVTVIVCVWAMGGFLVVGVLRLLHWWLK